MTRTKDLSMTEAIQQFIQRGRATAKAAPTSGLLRFFQDCRRRREEALISCLSKTLSPEGTAENRQISRPFGTQPSIRQHPALKRRAIFKRPSGTKTRPQCGTCGSNPPIRRAHDAHL